MTELASQAPLAAERAILAACAGVTVEHATGGAAVRALADVDVALHEGESVALWGPSGSGKTTLLHVLGGLTVPTSGTVFWEGSQLSSLDAAARTQARARGIAYIFQGSNLLPAFTAYENVAFAAQVSGGDEVRGRALELLALVGLEGKADDLPSELSGGEAQRVAIARALAQRPRLLLCDEPTGQLDADTSRRVLALLTALHRRYQLTLVVATHDADIAASLGRCIELLDGRVVEGDT